MLKKRKFREIRESEKFNENFPLVFTISTILFNVNRVMRNLRLSSSLKKNVTQACFGKKLEKS